MLLIIDHQHPRDAFCHPHLPGRSYATGTRDLRTRATLSVSCRDSEAKPRMRIDIGYMAITTLPRGTETAAPIDSS